MIEAKVSVKRRKKIEMTHLERAASIIGALLVGIAAYLVVTERKLNRSRRNQPPVEELAQELKQAWAGYHNR